jgi:uncharacterized cupredoxin-like copper-binding protein
MTLRVALALLLPAVTGYAAGAHEPPEPRTIEISARYSAFDPEQLNVSAGSRITFVVHNRDPIDHEFIIGNDAVQEAHESGTEAHHGDKPGEISVPAGETARTTYEFDRGGTLIFGCHLPGHYDYGMRGTIRVV